MKSCKDCLRYITALLLVLFLYLESNKWSSFIVDEDQTSIEQLVLEEDLSDNSVFLLDFFIPTYGFDLILAHRDYLPLTTKGLKNYQASFFKQPLFIQFSQLKLGDFI